MFGGGSGGAEGGRGSGGRPPPPPPSSIFSDLIWLETWSLDLLGEGVGGETSESWDFVVGVWEMVLILEVADPDSDWVVSVDFVLDLVLVCLVFLVFLVFLVLGLAFSKYLGSYES